MSFLLSRLFLVTSRSASVFEDCFSASLLLILSHNFSTGFSDLSCSPDSPVLNDVWPVPWSTSTHKFAHLWMCSSSYSSSFSRSTYLKLFILVPGVESSCPRFGHGAPNHILRGCFNVWIVYFSSSLLLSEISNISFMHNQLLRRRIVWKYNFVQFLHWPDTWIS